MILYWAIYDPKVEKFLKYEQPSGQLAPAYHDDVDNPLAKMSKVFTLYDNIKNCIWGMDTTGLKFVLAYYQGDGVKIDWEIALDYHEFMNFRPSLWGLDKAGW